MIAMITTVFAIQSTLALRSDEASGILEPQLAGALSRTGWATRRLLIPAIGSALLLLLGGALMGAGYGAIVGDPGQTGRLALAALAYWPAVMVFVGARGGAVRLVTPAGDRAELGRAGGDVVRRADRRCATSAELGARPAAVLGNPLPAAGAAELDATGAPDAAGDHRSPGWAWRGSAAATSNPAERIAKQRKASTGHGYAQAIVVRPCRGRRHWSGCALHSLVVEALPPPSGVDEVGGSMTARDAR